MIITKMMTEGTIAPIIHRLFSGGCVVKIGSAVGDTQSENKEVI